MHERIIPLLGALLAFYVVFVLLFPNTRIFDTDGDISMPTTEDTGKSGYYGLKTWLEKSNIPVHSLRDRYLELAGNPELAEEGNLLIVSLPLRLSATHDELEELRTWIASGNHAIFLVAMSDWPDWAKRTTSHTIDQLLDTIGLQIYEDDQAEETDQDDKQSSEAEKTPDSVLEKAKQSDFMQAMDPVREDRELIPLVDHPLTQNIQQLAVWKQNTEGDNWQLGGTEQVRSTLPLFVDKLDADPAVWLAFSGKASVIITRHADLFGNRSLARADNARLLENIVRTLLSEKGMVIFDDMHQGLRNIYDADAFYKDTRLHITLLFLVGLWFTYILGHTNRFAPAHAKIRRLRLVEHVSAIGDLFARRLHSSAVALRLAHHFFNEVRSYYALPLNGQPVWDKLEHNSAIDPGLLDRTRKAYLNAKKQEKVNLIKFNNNLNNLRRNLQ